MFKIFTNKTATPQQVMTISGESISFMPGESISVDLDKMYYGELKRSEKFFKIKEAEPVQIVSPRASKVSVVKKEVEEENEYGGNE